MPVMLCPKACGGALQFGASGAQCTACGHVFALRGRVLDLVGGEQETKLDVAAYDKMVGDPAINTRMFQQLVDVLAKIGKTDIPVTVEFGAGTGAWTVGMDRSPQFHELFATDLSFEFQEVLGARVTAEGTHLVCQSAEALDFRDGSIDLVASRSFLHHILDYEALLAKCARWLKPDGVAVFFEPCMQGKIWVAFFAELIRQIDANVGVKTLDADQSNRLQALMRHILKDHYRKDIATMRPLTEDKWIFDVDALRKTAKEVGFSNLSVIDDGAAQELIPAIKTSLIGPIKDHAILNRYNPIFDAFASTFAIGLPQSIKSPMVFFVFEK
jgi:ubiquinone/menaquinone biosynthesis C-methylase UbiE